MFHREHLHLLHQSLKEVTHRESTRGSSSHRVVHRRERCSALSFQAASFGPALRMRQSPAPAWR